MADTSKKWVQVKMAVLKQMINKLVYCVFTQIQLINVGDPVLPCCSHTKHVVKSMVDRPWLGYTPMLQQVKVGAEPVYTKPSELEMQAVTVARWGAIPMDNSFNKTPNQTWGFQSRMLSLTSRNGAVNQWQTMKRYNDFKKRSWFHIISSCFLNLITWISSQLPNHFSTDANRAHVESHSNTPKVALPVRSAVKTRAFDEPRGFSNKPCLIMFDTRLPMASINFCHKVAESELAAGVWFIFVGVLPPFVTSVTVPMFIAGLLTCPYLWNVGLSENGARPIPTDHISTITTLVKLTQKQTDHAPLKIDTHCTYMLFRQ